MCIQVGVALLVHISEVKVNCNRKTVQCLSKLNLLNPGFQPSNINPIYQCALVHYFVSIYKHAHPWLVELSISVLICRTQFIYKNDALGHGNFNSKMATSFQITSLGQPGQGSEICLQNTFWHMAVLPLMVQKNYDNQCVEYQQPIILYHQHFFVHQLFFYLQAKM